MKSKDFLNIIRRAGVAFAMALAVALSACASNGKDASSGGELPEITPMPETYSGGAASENINAKEVSLPEDMANGAYDISIKFVHGSLVAGVDEAAAAEVPAYRAYKLSFPERIVLEFENLSYWDYERGIDIADDDPALFGIFNVTELDGGKLSLYFQLKQDSDFIVTGQGDTLTLSILPKENGESAPGCFITANALAAFREGKLAGSSLTPALSSDKEHVLLISKAFETRQDAQKSLDELMASTAALELDGHTSIIELNRGALPDYDESLDYSEVLGLKPVRIAGEARPLPVLMPDGIYLCSTADGRTHLLTRPLSGELDEDSMVDMQELWIADSDGRTKRLTNFEFAAVEQAAFSPEGRRLAILERTEDSSFLYIYDMETNELSYNLGEEGFGSMTSNFVWDNMGTAVYAISGTEQLQLLKYDFTIPDETKRVSRVDETPVGDGDLGFFDGDLYFSDVSAQGESIIYKIKPEGGVRTEYAKGASFRISPDNRYMAIMTSTSLGGDETETTDSATLALKSIATGEESIIVKDKFVVDFNWDSSGRLYFCAAENIEDTEDQYPFKIAALAPDGEPQDICDAMAPSFYPVPEHNMLFLPIMQEWEGTHIRATYILDLG